MKTTLRLAFITLATTAASAALADFDDFESFIPDQSITGQGEWTVEDSFGNSGEPFDEEIVDDGTGNQVWRISNAFTSTSYSNQPFSSKPTEVAGETGAELYNDYGMDHTMPNNPPLSSATATSKNFYGAWDFKSATGGAQTGLSMTVSAGASQSPLRLTWLNMSDSGSGFDLSFYETAGSTFVGPTVIATGLNYSDWHRVEMYIEFVDGLGPGAPGSELGNDIVQVYLDGSLIHTGTTWESYFYNVNDGVPAPSVRAVDSLLFRQSGTAVPGNAGFGFYFDNIDVSNAAAIPEPGSIALAGLAGLAGIASLRRRRK